MQHTCTDLICQTEKELETVMLKQMRKLAENDCLDETTRKDTYGDDIFPNQNTTNKGFKKRGIKAATKKISQI